MTNDKITHLTSGQFATLCNISKDKLFHYEKLGLLTPSYKASNGYRYYTLDQIDTLHMIGVLKELGLSLSDIKELLASKTLSDYIQVLQAEQLRLEKKILQLHSAQQILTDKLSQVKNITNLEDSCTLLETLSSETMIVSEPFDYTNELSVAEQIVELYEYCQKNNIQILHDYGLIKNCSLISNPGTPKPIQVYLKIFDNQPSNKIHLKPAGTYVVTYHSGDYTSIQKVYNSILHFIELHNLDIVGPIYEYECTMLSPTKITTQKIFKLQIPVKSSIDILN